MKLPDGITFEQTLLGSGHGNTVRGQEHGAPVIVKSPGSYIDLFSDTNLEGASHASSGADQFESEKSREQKAAAKSNYFIKGRLQYEDGVAFWIRPCIPRSLREKVAFKEVPKSEELGKICRAIAKALAELNQIDQSGHGNLSLGNVLLDDKAISDIKLVDLSTANKVNDRKDKRALGLIIYQLVNGELVELDDKISSVPEDDDWNMLGATENLWREFCSELLNPYGKYADSSWEQIDQALRAIEAFSKKRKTLKITLLVSVFLVLGAGLLFIWKLKFQEEEIVVDLDTIQGQWLELLDNYFSWGGNYLQSKSDFKGTDDEAFMERFYNDRKARLPMKIIGRVTGQGARLLKLAEEVYEDARMIDVLLLDNSKQKQIVLAYNFLMGLRMEIENWEVLQELSDANQEFTELGFEFGINETRRLIDSISFTDRSLSLSGLYTLKTSAAVLDELQSLYTRFEAQVAVLDKVPDTKFLPLYANYMQKQLAGAVDDPITLLRAMVSQAADLLSYWEEEKSRIEQDLFFKSERKFLKGSEFVMGEEAVTAWKDLVKTFRLIELPSLDSGRLEFSGSGENIRQLTEQINELQKPGSTSAKFEKEFEKLYKRFEKEVDLPLIEANRAAIESVVSNRITQLRALVEQAEDRWAELNPDIGERLEQLSKLPDSLPGSLIPAWQSYLESEVNVRTKDSFAGPREFILFQREYFKKLKKFEYFANTQLTQISPDWSDDLSDIRQELLPALQETRKSYYDTLVAEWIGQITPVLLSADTKSSIETPSDAYQKRMEAYLAQLRDYAKLLSNTLDMFAIWELPQEGIVNRWDALNKGEPRKEWGQSSAFTAYADQVKLFYEMEQGMEAHRLFAIFQEAANPAFGRATALKKRVDLDVIPPDKLVQVAEVIAELKQYVPADKVEGFDSFLSALWVQALETDTLDADTSEQLVAYYSVMGVRPDDLTGQVRFRFEVSKSLVKLKESEARYLEAPKKLEEIINDLLSLLAKMDDSRVSAILDALRNVDLSQAKVTLENAPFIEKGWSIEDKENEDRMVLAWQNHRLLFHRIKDEANDIDFFIAEQEASIDLFNDWMTENKLWSKSEDSLPREWGIFISQAYNPIDDYRQGMNLWTIARRGLKRAGITTASKWFEVDTVVADEFALVESELFPTEEVSGSLPIQQVGAQLARFFAESAGMSLPTPEQWKYVTEDYLGDESFFWQSRLDSSLSVELVAELRSGSYYVERKIEESGYGLDQSKIISRVDEFSDEKFKHLAGNVAEYLYDPEADIYYVAGGSVFSETLSTWKDEHMVPRRNELTAYSDVGIRLALIPPDQSAYSQFRNILQKALEQN